jgi:hypothetical protein
VDGASVPEMLGSDEDGHLAEVATLVHELVGMGQLVEGHGAP